MMKVYSKGFHYFDVRNSNPFRSNSGGQLKRCTIRVWSLVRMSNLDIGNNE